MTTLYIKNMVCDRCKMVVNQELEKLGFHPEKVALNKIKPPRIVFLGNSITHFWGGEPKTSIVNGLDSWNHYTIAVNCSTPLTCLKV